MEKKDLAIGFLIGVCCIIAGTFLFLFMFTEFSSLNDLKIINESGVLGKVMAIGAVLNIASFYILLQKKKELMARGVILATIVLAIITVFV